MPKKNPLPHVTIKRNREEKKDRNDEQTRRGYPKDPRHRKPRDNLENKLMRFEIERKESEVEKPEGDHVWSPYVGCGHTFIYDPDTNTIYTHNEALTQPQEVKSRLVLKYQYIGGYVRK